MNQEEYQDPTSCDRCLNSVEQGWSERWVDSSRIECVCFKCDDEQRVIEYRNTDVLSSKLITSAALAEVRMEHRLKPESRSYGEPPGPHEETYTKINNSYKRLHLEVKEFEKLVWFNGLQAQVLGAEFRGFRMNFGSYIALVYSMAGRTQITIETINKDIQITLITADNESKPVMGINGLTATENQAMNLLRVCKEAFLRGKKFTRNDKIGIGF